MCGPEGCRQKISEHGKANRFGSHSGNRLMI